MSPHRRPDALALRTDQRRTHLEEHFMLAEPRRLVPRIRLPRLERSGGDRGRVRAVVVRLGRRPFEARACGACGRSLALCRATVVAELDWELIAQRGARRRCARRWWERLRTMVGRGDPPVASVRHPTSIDIAEIREVSALRARTSLSKCSKSAIMGSLWRNSAMRIGVVSPSAFATPSGSGWARVE